MDATLSRRSFKKLLLCVGASTLLPVPAWGESSRLFVHPGMLHSSADLARMRDGVTARLEPILSGFNAMSANEGSQLSYKSKGAFAEIGRNPTIHSSDFDRDANAAYQCALMWTITGDRRYARLSIGIVDDWARTLKAISGADAVLCAALGGFKIANAAEILRHTASGWTEDRAQRFEAMLRHTFLPVIFNFACFANGNWDTAAIKLMMAIGVFCEDRSLFDRAIKYYLHGCGDGALPHYIYANGQCQESGRDQQHTQLGLAHMGDACEMAWHQGLDLYGELDNRLLLGFEYTSKYELGEDVPFVPDIDQTGQYRHVSISPRSRLRNNFEQIYNHYVNRMGLEAPWVTKAAEKVRPEGAPFGADATGYGTLLYTRPPGQREARNARAKTVVYADDSNGSMEMSFVPLTGVSRFDLWRAEQAGGPFSRVARDLAPGAMRDASAVASRRYFYAVSGAGSTVLSAPAAQMLGLPEGWQSRAVGIPAQSGTGISCNGSSFLLHSGEPSGAEALTQYRMVERTMPANGSLVARLSPLIASLWAQAGLVVRGENGSASLSVVSDGKPDSQRQWMAILAEQQGKNAVKVAGQQVLGAPMTDWGRIHQEIWLRGTIANGRLEGSFSNDGAVWQSVGQATLPQGQLFCGMMAASGIQGVSTDVIFDMVRVD